MNHLLLLLAQDSIKIAHLERIYLAHRENPTLASDAISAMRQLDSDLAWRAVWILKQLARDGKLSAADLTRLAQCAEEATHWAARLNLCQLFSQTGCPVEMRETLFPYLEESFANRRVIIRAWALSTLVGFRDDKKMRPRIDAMLREARADPNASMKARLRHLPKYRAKRAPAGGRAP
jgi:hypothetical protein